MLYWLHDFKYITGLFNVFQYQTFRAGGAVVTALVVSLALGPSMIAWLRRYKIGQVQRTDGPASHMSKQGTPTMGGLLIFAAVMLTSLLWMRLDVDYTWLMLGVTVALTAVGFWDDYLKLVKKDPRGASSKVKFAVQIATGLGVAAFLAVDPPNPHFATHLNVPYLKEVYLNLGPFYYVLVVFAVVGSSNAVNLTDGLDGLAAGSIIFCALAYAIFAYMAGNVKFADYLRIIHVPEAGEIAIFLGSIIGACLGFLWYNAFPAEVFMGDTSSLFLGGVIGAAALVVKQEFLLPLVGGVFVMETLSVIIQMAVFKLQKGRRFFKMAPIHHHFELSGVAEPKVTVRFWIVSIVLMLAALASLKIR